MAGHRRFKVLGYVLIYVVLASLWAVVSSVALETIASHSSLRNQLEVYKDLLFVVFTGVALYVLLKSWRLEKGRIEGRGSLEGGTIGAKEKIQLPIVYLIALLMVVASSSYVFFVYLKKNESSKIRQSLSAIATLKAGQINGWLKQNIHLAVTVGQGSYFAQTFGAWSGKEKFSKVEKRWLQSRLSSLQKRLGYQELAVFDTSGKSYFRSGDLAGKIDPYWPALIKESIQRRLPVMGKMHWRENADGRRRISLPMAAPIIPSGMRNDVVGILVVDLDPQKDIFPLIEAWPTDSKTAETSVFVREGDDVVFLNKLRRRKRARLSREKMRVFSPDAGGAGADGRKRFYRGSGRARRPSGGIRHQHS